MGGTIHFNWKDLDTLLKDARRAWQQDKEPRTLYGDTTGRGFWIVGDEGIYLMHNGKSHICKSGIVQEPSPGDGYRVVYANEANPDKDPDSCWDNKRRYFGGDDGCEFLPADHIEQWLIWNKGKKTCPHFQIEQHRP